MSRDVPRETWRTLLRGSLSGDLKSHPGKRLIDHLLGTAELSRQIVEFHGLKDIAFDVEAAALTHDPGKAALEFQKYLTGKGKGVNHSLPSSFFTFSLQQESAEPFDAFFSVEAVRRHHSKIEDWSTSSPFWANYRASQKKIGEDMRALLPQWPCPLDERCWKNFIYAIDDRYPEDFPFPDYWLKLRSVLSVLVAGDRLDAINVKAMGLQPLPDFTPYSFPSVAGVSERRRVTDAWRSEVAESCLRSVAEIHSPGLFTLTLPTGAGKTNIGLRTAHTLAKKLRYSTIVYALPFISIVEQNAKFAKDVFGVESVQEDHSLMLSGLDDGDEAENESSEYDIPGKEADRTMAWRRSMRLFRYWGSPVIVTTMVQLWNTIFNPKAGATIDFHRLRSAVVLMDEPQGINCHLWPELGKVLSFIHERWGTVFILMTATQPRIFEGTELAPRVCFPFSRHRYRFVEGKHLLSDLPGLLREHIPAFSESSGMLVFNTRGSARAAYELLKPLFGDAPVFMLSRWMTPRHRRETLDRIKDLERKGETHYLIATQVVEAGVDLDFNWVFRDLAPLDSLIQVAGRCNRSGEREDGFVLITALQNGNGRSFAGPIYDDVLMDHTRLLLEESPEFDEGDVPDIVTRYYEKISNSIEPKALWKNIKEGKWGEYIPLFKEMDFDVPVYVDHDGNLDDLLNKLMTLDRTLDNRERLKALNSRLQQYAIGVKKDLLKGWLDRVGNFVGGSSQNPLEQYGDYCVVRRSGIGDGPDSPYHPEAGFSPCRQSAGLDDC